MEELGRGGEMGVYIFIYGMLNLSLYQFFVR